MRDLVKKNRIAPILGVLLLGLIVATVGCTALGTRGEALQAEMLQQVEEEWGVRPVAVRLTGAGHFIDFRIRVTDPEKAKEVLNRNHKAYLVDDLSGKVLPVPMTKLGPLRGSDMMPKKDRTYVILFQNVERILHAGSKVSVVIGDFEARGLIVS
ncbi:MAG: hypothetical protein ACOWWM_10115 [Desulfobacterales bacterium]